MSRMDKSRDLWRRKQLEPAEKPKEPGWISAKAASPVRSLSPDEWAAALEKMGIKL